MDSGNGQSDLYTNNNENKSKGFPGASYFTNSKEKKNGENSSLKTLKDESK